MTFSGVIQEKGERIDFSITSPSDLNRMVVKSDSACLSIPSLDFEIPPGTQKGTISTLEGILKRAADDLQALQPKRLKLGDIDNFHRCQHVIDQLKRIMRQSESDDDRNEESGSDDKTSLFPLSIVLDDPAGNSFLENPNAPTADPNVQCTRYFRTPTQDMALGLQPAAQAVETGIIDDTKPLHKNPVNAAQGTHEISIDKCASSNDACTYAREEAIKFQTPCPHCHKEAETDMCLTDIPHFKQVVIMCLLCEHCGYRSNEIKGGGAIPSFGTKITIVVRGSDDLAREVLKSDTAGVAIPQLELQLDEGGGEGVYTTVEGLLRKLHDQLKAANPFASGDAATKQHLENNGGEFSAPSPNHVRYTQFLEKLKDCVDGKSFPFTLVISDPLSNSFVGPVPRDAIALSKQVERDGNNDCYEAYVDKGMSIEEYERTYEQNETLGLNDIKTEHHQDGNGGTSFGTDSLQELPDRLCRLEVRGPDYPHIVGKAPVKGDGTNMGGESVVFAVPGMVQRGRRGEGPEG